MVLNLDQVNTKIKEWKANSDALHTNVLELQSQIEYSLAGDGSLLKGKTLERFLRAKAAENRLISDMDLFDEHLRKITLKSSQITIINRGKCLEELTELIEGNSVALPSEMVALSSRQVFDQAEKANFTSAALVRQRLNADFSELRDFFTQLSKAWLGFDTQRELATAQLNQLKLRLKEHGKENIAEVAALEGRIVSTTKRWKSNPLEITENLQDDLKPYFTSVERQLALFEQEINKVAGSLQQAAQDLERLLAMRVETLQLQASCLNLISGTSGDSLAKTPPSLKALRESLSALQTLQKSGNKIETKTKLKAEVEKWQKDYTKFFRATVEARDSNAALLTKLENLKTRFSHAQTLANSLAQKGVELPRSVITFKATALDILQSNKIVLENLDSNVNSLEVKLGEIDAANKKAK